MQKSPLSSSKTLATPKALIKHSTPSLRKIKTNPIHCNYSTVFSTKLSVYLFSIAHLILKVRKNSRSGDSGRSLFSNLLCISAQPVRQLRWAVCSLPERKYYNSSRCELNVYYTTGMASERVWHSGSAATASKFKFGFSVNWVYSWQTNVTFLPLFPHK